MPQVFVPSGFRAQDDANLLADLELLLARVGRRRNRRLTVGTLVGAVRTKQFPDNPIAGQPVRVIFVADVRLRELEGMPVVRDVLVSNQAHQLVSGTAAAGTPVTVEIAAGGTLAIVGRAGFGSAESASDYYTVVDIGGINLDFAVGLRLRPVDDLNAGLLADLNAWRAGEGLDPLVPGDTYFADPQLDVHGERYFVGYVGLEDGGRFSAEIVGIICSLVTVSRDWYDDDVSVPAGDWWYGTPNAFPNQDPWYAQRTETVCS